MTAPRRECEGRSRKQKEWLEEAGKSQVPPTGWAARGGRARHRDPPGEPPVPEGVRQAGSRSAASTAGGSAAPSAAAQRRRPGPAPSRARTPGWSARCAPRVPRAQRDGTEGRRSRAPLHCGGCTADLSEAAQPGRGRRRRAGRRLCAVGAVARATVQPLPARPGSAPRATAPRSPRRRPPSRSLQEPPPQPAAGRQCEAVAGREARPSPPVRLAASVRGPGPADQPALRLPADAPRPPQGPSHRTRPGRPSACSTAAADASWRKAGMEGDGSAPLVRARRRRSSRPRCVRPPRSREGSSPRKRASPPGLGSATGSPLSASRGLQLRVPVPGRGHLSSVDVAHLSTPGRPRRALSWGLGCGVASLWGIVASALRVSSALCRGVGGTGPASPRAEAPPASVLAGSGLAQAAVGVQMFLLEEEGCAVLSNLVVSH